MFICGMVLQCTGTDKTWLESGQVAEDLTTTVDIQCRYKLLINDVKPILHSLNKTKKYLQYIWIYCIIYTTHL